MPLKNKKIIQCPYCNSNRLYLRRGLVADAFISLLTSVKSFTCGSCSRSFRKYNNYFTSKQALVHLLIIFVIVGFTNPGLLNPRNWLMTEQTTEYDQQINSEMSDKEVPPIDLTSQDSETFPAEIPTEMETALTDNATSSYTDNATSNSTGSNIITMVNGTDMNFNATAISSEQNSTVQDIPKKEPLSALENGRLNSIYFKDIDKKTRIKLDLGGSPLSYTSFFLRNPDRLVVDIHGSWEYFGPTTLKPENPIFSKFRIGIYEDKLRMVMDLKGDTPAPSITKTETGLNIDVK